MPTAWLIDKSAIVHLRRSYNAELWLQRIDQGLVRVTTLTLLEMGYSARSAEDLRREFTRPPLYRMPVEYLTPPIEDRALSVLESLAERGQHRAPSIADLLIAATAELSGLAVLHLDKDFGLIADITGQPLESLELAETR